MSGPFRLPAGGRIARGEPFQFTFDGRTVEAFAGDTLASALLAGGVRLVGRSFKYHRPRGVLSHGVDEPNALVSISRGVGRVEPNTRATVAEAVAGLSVHSQNRWPSLRHDFGAVNDRLAPLLAAGFYYKSFLWPRSFWRRLYEPAIRAAAGLGVAPERPDPDRYVHRYAHCEVLVVGAGPTGLPAALAASATGQRVMLVDEQPELGGALLHDVTSRIDGRPAQAWLTEAVATLAARPNVTLLPRTTAFGAYHDNLIGLVERLTDHLTEAPPDAPRERLWQVRAARVVLAAGALERPLPFADNDRPGVMLAESLRVYVNRYGVAPGRRVVIATSGASAYPVAADLRAAGLEVTVVDLRPEAECGSEPAAARLLGATVLTGQAVLRVLGRRGVRGVLVGGAGPPVTLACDALGVSGGWTPTVHLHSQARGRLSFAPGIDAFTPADDLEGMRVAGAARGTYDLDACLAEGWSAGGGATEAAPRATPASAVGFLPVREPPTPGGRVFVDLQNDVTAKDVRLAVQEGFRSIEHVKRYTTTGMATDQGKTSNMATVGLVASALGKALPDVGVTTFRPPFTPVTFGALAGPTHGELFDPLRRAPMDAWAEAKGAVFENVGLWRRARYFPRAGEGMRAAVDRECRAVRSAAGVCDASTLGKIEVVGPDAATFLERIYVNRWRGLAPGRCRYGLMLREDGFIFDDGVVSRLAPDRFHVTTTSGGDAAVLAHLEDYLQTEWPDLKVYLTSTTEQWAVIAIQGPKARDVLAPLVNGVDLGPAAFPHMSMAEGAICGQPMRLFRVSFTGELGYEVNVPADVAPGVWERVLQVGAPIGLTPYGTEAMHVLRAERGFIMVGHETDGTTTPEDVGYGWMISRAKGDFVGARSLARPELAADGRRQLVGLLTHDPNVVLEEGAQVLDPAAPSRPLGHVTSSYWSATCGRSIALALVAGGRGLHGQTLLVTGDRGVLSAEVVPPVFFGAEGIGAHG
jgi:sarcosine oxidase subunit alpha